MKKIKLYQKVKIARNRLSDIIVNKSNVITMNIVRVMKHNYKKDVVEVAQKTMKIAKTKLKRERKKREKERLKSWKSMFVKFRKIVQAHRKRLDVKEKDYVIVAVAD